jgi:non-ribosomal peptide synthetase component F
MHLEGLSIVNPQPARLPGPDLLHDLVKSPSEFQAIDYLENGTTTSLTYKELHEQSDKIARRITRSRGPVDNQLVIPVLIAQSPLLYTSLLGILKAGGAFCPLNIDAPAERVKFILSDVSAQIVLVSKELASRVPSTDGVIILVVDDDADNNDPSTINHRCPTTEDLAYVMYTSGSTGTPKGVALSHAAATQALLAHERHIPPFTRFLQFAAPTFDVFVFEAFFPLFRGSTLVSICRDELLNDLPKAMRQMEVDSCELTPTVAASLLRKRSNVPTLKLLLTIGEMLKSSVVEEFGGNDSQESMLWAMYGPTEATIHW